MLDMKMMLKFFSGMLSLTVFFSFIGVSATGTYAAPRQMEKLSRGLAVSKMSSGTLVSWCLLGTESPDTEFNLYRDGKKIASIGKTAGTNYLDKDGSVTAKYTVAPVVNGKEGEKSAASIVFNEFAEGVPYKTITGLNVPTDQTMPDNSTCSYSPNDMSVGDLDGDGELDLVLKWDPSNSQDNSKSGYTGTVFLDGLKMDGTLLWRINLGRNIRAGAHYTQFMVYDLDGDGIAEIVAKTSDGTVDGKGKVIGDANADYRSSSGTIMTGNEYLTIFKGTTGEAIHTIDYWPARGKISGDNYGNRDNRMLAAVAYLDGVHPSVIMSRGYYTEFFVAAYDFDGRQLKQRWIHSSDKSGQGLYGEGNHNLSVGDVNSDGFDEIIMGSAALKPDGTLLYRTGFGHGDAMHLSDMDPDRPGLEVYDVHEETTNKYSEEFRTYNGDVVWGTLQSTLKCTTDGKEHVGCDNGRGMAADIDSTNRGYEMWSGTSGGVRTVSGTTLSTVTPSVNFRLYFDGDLQDELLDATGGGGSGGKIEKWNSTTKSVDRYLTFYKINGSTLNNSTKANPCISADLFGDWREEFIVRSSTDPSMLTIFSTPVATPHRLYTLLHDPQYRVSVAWQNVAYNQPPHTSYYLPDMVKSLKQPVIFIAGEGSAEEDTHTLVNDGKSEMDASTPKVGEGLAEKSNEGYLLNGYYNFANSLSSYGTWEIFSPKEVKTTLTVRFTNGGNSSRDMAVNVNGKSAGTISFPTTDPSWTVYSDAKIDVVLQPGVNTLTFASLSGDGGPNFDMFTFGTDGIEIYDGSQKVPESIVPAAPSKNGVVFSPTTGTLFTPKAGFAEIYFYDVSGVMRFGISRNVAPGANALVIDRSAFSKGMYVVKVKLDGVVMQRAMFRN